MLESSLGDEIAWLRVGNVEIEFVVSFNAVRGTFPESDRGVITAIMRRKSTSDLTTIQDANLSFTARLGVGTSQYTKVTYFDRIVNKTAGVLED